MAIKINKLIARSYSYGGYRSLSSVKYQVIHYTGNNGDTAKGNCNYFANSNTRSAGAHFFISQNGEIWQSVEIDRIAWSVGGSKYSNCGTTGGGSYYGSCTNANSVSIELCDNESKDPSEAQIKACKKLIAWIKGKCPNATKIIRHFDVTGKECPARMAPTCSADKASKNAKWNNFKKKVSGGKAEELATTKPPTSTKTTTYKVKVSDGTLNIRSGAGAGFEKIGSLKNGTKVEINGTVDGWGYIPKKKGWVKMSFVEKVKSTSSSTKTKTTTTSTFKSYLVKVTAGVLNVRQKPDGNSKIVDTVRKGDVFTIVDKKGEWGLLKSYQKNRDGWCNLNYVKKC